MFDKTTQRDIGRVVNYVDNIDFYEEVTFDILCYSYHESALQPC
jgi:hypothetical protein